MRNITVEYRELIVTAVNFECGLTRAQGEKHIQTI